MSDTISSGSIAAAVEDALRPLRPTITEDNLAEVQDQVMTALSGALFEAYGRFARVVDVTVDSSGQATWRVELSGALP